MALLDDIATMIEMVPGLGTRGTNLFAAMRPPRPDNIIALYESSGFEPERTMGRLVMEIINLQVFVRDLSAATGRDRAHTTMMLLDRFTGVINGVTYYSILARHSPFALGTDENNRHQFSCNLIVRKEPS